MSNFLSYNNIENSLYLVWEKVQNNLFIALFYVIILFLLLYIMFKPILSKR